MKRHAAVFFLFVAAFAAAPLACDAPNSNITAAGGGFAVGSGGGYVNASSSVGTGGAGGGQGGNVGPALTAYCFTPPEAPSNGACYVTPISNRKIVSGPAITTGAGGGLGFGGTLGVGGLLTGGGGLGTSAGGSLGTGGTGGTSGNGGSGGTGGTGGSATGPCAGIITEPTDCGICVENACCSVLAACNAIAGCVDCVLRSAPESECQSAAIVSAVEAIDICGRTNCDATCGGTCNPVTNAPCPTGTSCDVDPGGGPFRCLGGNDTSTICEPCDEKAGPYCAPDSTCFGGVCARYCCDDTDCCGGFGIDCSLVSCDKTQHVDPSGAVGVCLTTEQPMGARKP